MVSTEKGRLELEGERESEDDERVSSQGQKRESDTSTRAKRSPMGEFEPPWGIQTKCESLVEMCKNCIWGWREDEGFTDSDFSQVYENRHGNTAQKWKKGKKKRNKLLTSKFSAFQLTYV